jgi:hypothetical protein
MTPPANQGFVPLAIGPVSNSQRKDFRVLVAERPETARPILESNPALAPGASGPSQRPACEPRVTLQREADRITGIHIECSCGQLIDLKCAYSE